jgi:hypothetical protein
MTPQDATELKPNSPRIVLSGIQNPVVNKPGSGTLVGWSFTILVIRESD